MIDVCRFIDGLKALGVDFFTVVPDSLVKSFCAYVTDICSGIAAAGCSSMGAGSMGGEKCCGNLLWQSSLTLLTWPVEAANIWSLRGAASRAVEPIV